MTSPMWSAPAVTRTFSPFRESESEDTDFEFWFHHAYGRGITWSELIRNRLVAVVGEAGIGKTHEFRLQAQRLQAERKAAFFIPLNLLKGPDDWPSALDKQADLFGEWIDGTEQGYFFLDAVDEARLTGPDALRRALDCVKRALAGHLHRVAIFVSSRLSDWNLPHVRELVERQIDLPVAGPDRDSSKNTGEATTRPRGSSDSIQPSVYCLDPLSVDAGKQLAAHYGVTEVATFWREVADGAYEFLATRPLDLEWMAQRWKSVGKLGRFKDLVEDAVTNRLTEKNPGYVESGAVLSSEQLRQGAEALAAASVFSGCAYIRVEPGPPPVGVMAPAEVLPQWTPVEHQRLLGSAIFDEATYGRVQFHHRAVREYLAAWWVKRQLDAGLPFSEAWALFARAPYGEELLLPSRRAVLCWLAALDAKVRSRLIRSFPEMVIFEGDPQQWSTDDVVEAFAGYLERLKSGFRPDWWNDASEFRRFARMIPPPQLSTWIEAYRDDFGVLSKLLTIAKYGRVETCAEQVFALYRAARNIPRLLRYSLDALSVIAGGEQRAAISQDLLDGRLLGNEQIAAGIEAVGLSHLSVDQLVKCFAQTEPENDYGGGAMATAIAFHLLPNATLHEAMALLAAILKSLPALGADKLLHHSEAGETREGWMFHALPDVLSRVLVLSAPFEVLDPELIENAALVTEKLRHTIHVNDEDLRNLRAAIARFPNLRKAVALRIATSDIPHAISSLTWMSGVVHFDQSDLDWLVLGAADCIVESAVREIWYACARDIAFQRLRGRRRRSVVSQLVAGPDAERRRADVEKVTSQYIQGVQTRRKWHRDSIGRARAERVQREKTKAELIREVEGIRGGVAYGAVEWLVIHSSRRSGRSRYTKADPEVIGTEFGAELGAAFSEGLARAWRHIDAPDSTKYLDNKVPWRGLIGLASANYAFRTGLDKTTLTADEVGKLVRLCVWELGDLDDWFGWLAEARTTEVCDALRPWFEFELTLGRDTPIRRTIEMVLAGPQAIKAALLPVAISRVKDGAVPDERLRQTLVSAAAAAGLVGGDLLGGVARVALESGFGSAPPRFESGWFSEWASIDFAAAWKWFVGYRDKWPGTQVELVEQLAGAMDTSSNVWKSFSKCQGNMSDLLSIYRLLDSHLQSAAESGTNG